jgi:uroporphyrinogen decarboxylase
MKQFRNPRFIKALQRQAVDRTPVWIMRQAGRYLAEYQALRAKAGDFLKLCKTPELACAATMLPINKFPLDAAIIFSDILMIPDAMGLDLNFVADEGPKFSRVISNAADVARLPEIDMQRDLSFLNAAVEMVVQELDDEIPLIGFAGSPWTVATYMIEGQTSKQFNKVRGMLYKDPTTLHALLEHLTQQTTNYLIAQIKAGVSVVMLFDTWGGILADPLYLEFSLQYMRKIVTSLKQSYATVPIILFSKNGGRCVREIAATGCDAIGLDWTADLAVARALVGDKVALQGNLDPCVLYADPQQIRTHVQEVLQAYGDGNGHIFNLGHGIPLDVNPQHVEVMLEAIKTYSPAFHKQSNMVTT